MSCFLQIPLPLQQVQVDIFSLEVELLCYTDYCVLPASHGFNEVVKLAQSGKKPHTCFGMLLLLTQYEVVMEY